MISYSLVGSETPLEVRTNAVLRPRRGSTAFEVWHEGKWRRVWWGIGDCDWFRLNGERVPLVPTYAGKST